MKKIIILVSILILTFSCFSICYAYTYPEMTEEIAQDIINHFKNPDYCFYYYTGSTPGSSENVINTLNNLDITGFVNKFNQYITSYQGDLTWDNITVLFYNGAPGGGDGNNNVNFTFYISKNETNLELSNLEIYNYYNGATFINNYNFNSGDTYYLQLLTLDNGNWDTYGVIKNDANIHREQFYPSTTFSNYISGDEIFVPCLYGITDNQYIYCNNVRYKIGYFISNEPTEPDIPSGDSSGDTENDNSHTTYYNYDFNDYFIRPYIEIDTINGLIQYEYNEATVPFSIYSQSGDEYYPFDYLKMDLRVYQISQDSNGKLYSQVIDSYKRYSGEYENTSGFINTSTNGNIIRHTFNLRSKFDSNFIDQYINNSGDTNYGFQLVLYNFWGDEISSTNLFYFHYENLLNNYPVNNNNYYDNLLNNENTDYTSLIETFKTFMSSIMSFWSFLPPWLIALLTLGVTAAIALRVLGR